MNTDKRNTISTIVFILLAVLLVIFFAYVFGSAQKQDITYDEFLEELNKGNVYAVYMDGYTTVKVIFNDSQTYASQIAKKISIKDLKMSSNYDAKFNIAQRTAFEDAMRQFKAANPALNFQMDYSDEDAVSILSYLPYLLLIGGTIIIAVLLTRAARQQTTQGMTFGKSKAKVTQNVKIRFTDVAGAEEEKEELQETIDFLKHPKKFSEVGARIPHGILLVGPPGTGKTLFAKAVAGESGVPFFSMSGSDFVELYVGIGASRVRDLFETAKKNTPCIIFIDEIDAVGRQRGAGLGGGHDEREQTLNQILVEMDGFETNSGVIVMAATNRQDILDPALMRPGRFDRRIFVNLPDVRGREAILRVHSRNKPIGDDVDFKIAARITSGFTGADLENLLNESAILAVRNGRKVITMNDINEGLNKVVMGPAKKSRLVTEPDKRITAYHESGHAILAASLKYCDPVHEVTVIPRGQAAGFTMTRPENDNDHMFKEKLLDDITMTLGGRIAEELVIINVSSGASQDIKIITQIANKMVTEWGMSQRLGPLYYGSGGEVFVGRNFQSSKGYSEEVAAIIDEEVRAIVDSCHKRGTELLKGKMDVLHNMARVLFEKETIRNEEVNMLLGGKTAAEVIAYMEEKERKQIRLNPVDVKIRDDGDLFNLPPANPQGDKI